jgi:Carbohydrate esterase, sialic acid-specific acetylesterase
MRVSGRIVLCLLTAASCDSSSPSAIKIGNMGQEAGTPEAGARIDAAFDASYGDAWYFDAADAKTDADASAQQSSSALFDYWGMIHTGQSLSVGIQGKPIDMRPQPFANLMLVDATNQYDNDGDMLSLQPLVGPLRPLADDAPYPNNVGGEPPGQGMSNQLSAITLAAEGRALVSIPSIVGQGGMGLANIEKQADPQYPGVNSNPQCRSYWASLYEATQIKKLAQAAGKTYGIGAVVLTHGETDAVAGMPENVYADGIYRLINNYRTDLKAITGQTFEPPLLLAQQSVMPGVVGSRGRLMNAVLSAAAAHPDAITVVGPQYMYEYGPDHLHLTAPGYERLGEKYAEVFYERVFLGRLYRPLQPTQITHSGTQVRIKLHVPHLPLSFDDAFPVFPIVGHPWAKGHGFEVSDAADAAIEITSISIGTGADADVVTLQLARDPGANTRVAYAITQAGQVPFSSLGGGETLGKHGNLRDTDPFLPRDKFTLMVTVNGAFIGAPGAFMRTTNHDRVTFAGQSGEWTVMTHTADTVTLDRAVPIAAGTNVAATLMSDQRNYGVAFEQIVP